MRDELLWKDEVGNDKNWTVIAVEIRGGAIAMRVATPPSGELDLLLTTGQAAELRDALITGCARCGIE
jgi:hypothetical protein